MKRLLVPLCAFILVVTGYSLQASGCFGNAESSQPVVQEADPHDSEAAFRHRVGGGQHWRAMLMVK